MYATYFMTYAYDINYKPLFTYTSEGPNKNTLCIWPIRPSEEKEAHFKCRRIANFKRSSKGGGRLKQFN